MGFKKDNEINYEIIEHYGVLSESSSGWRKELNLVSWNGKEPKYDLRDWSEDHTKMGKGGTLDISELKTLLEILPRATK